MTDWVFDLGNSRLKFAPLHDDGRLGEVRTVVHDGARFDADEVRQLPTGFEVAYLASVAATEVRVALLELLAARCRLVVRAGTQTAWDGVRIAYPEPRRLGVDRFLTLLGAHTRDPRPWLVVGVGTALTIDLIDGQGLHRGGRIAPSPTTMRLALRQRAVQLPAEGGHYVEFADDTADALASGCIGAAVALVERSTASATVLLGARPTVLLHGGGAHALLPLLPGAVHAPALVLEGLACWARTERCD